MKKLLLACAVILMIASCKNNPTTPGANTSDNPVTVGKGKFALKSGIVEYKTKMMGMDATQVTYFDDYGGLETNEVTMEMAGMKMRTLTVTRDGFVYNFDPDRKTGTKTALSSKKDNFDFENVTDEFRKDFNLKNMGEEPCNGKSCIKYSIENESLGMKGYYWVWKGIPMKTDIDMGTAKMLMDAVKVQENVPVPAVKFEVPADIKFE